MSKYTRILLVLLLVVVGMHASAQDRVLWGTHTLTNDIYNPQRSHFSYSGGSVAFGVGNIFLDGNFNGPFWDQLTDSKNFKNDSIPKKGIIDNYLRPSSIGGDINADIFLFKLRTSRKKMGEFSLSARVNGVVSQEFSTGLWGLPFTGNKYLSGKKNEGFLNAQTLTDFNVQVGLGYRQNINDKIGVGGQFSVYHAPGLVNASIDDSYFLQDTTQFRIEAYANGGIIASGPGVANLVQGRLNVLNPDTTSINADSLLQESISAALSFKNMGYGLSFGVDYEPKKNMFLTALIRDLGWINYNNNTKKYVLNDTISFNGVPVNESFGIDSGYIDSIANFENYIVDTLDIANYYKYLPAKLTFGGGYPITKRWIARGFYSINLLPNRPADPEKLSILKYLTSGFANRRKELALSLDYKSGAFNWIINYSTVNNGNQFAGLSMVYRAHPLDFFIGFEKLLFAGPLAGQIFVEDSYQKYIPKPVLTPGIGLNFGVAVRLGRSNKRYEKVMAKREAKEVLAIVKPKKVVLLSDTMIVDTDGDGIQDIHDECPFLKGAVSNNGCPEPDTDGDGVIDKIDKCPNEYGLSRLQGCPIPDTDKDGINDEEDQCPQVPGMPKYQGCPPPDRDNDGVIDEEDQCPDVFGTKALNGCPPPEEVSAPKDTIPTPPPVASEAPKEKVKEVAPTPVPPPVVAKPKVIGTKSDRDGDGVTNYLDACPEVVGYSYNNGCPDSNGVALSSDDLKTINLIVLFNTNTNGVGKDYYEKLKKIKDLMQANPKYKLEVQGYADNVGKDEYNQALSERRAEEVRTYLTKAGIDASRMNIKGYGIDNPIKSNDAESTRKFNRRVVFKLSE
jgi:outer membrane protein OmpA-like peptidoglycan-associated protein